MPASRSQRSRAVLHARRPVGEEPGRLHARGDVGQRGGAGSAVSCRTRGRSPPRDAACATPTARAAMLMRPVSSPAMTCLKPRPSTPPTRLAAGHGEAVEDQLRGVHALVAELGDGLDDLEPGRALLHDEARHAAVARRSAAVSVQGEQREGVALAAVGDEHLRAGDAGSGRRRRRATVRMACTSEPACGSVRQSPPRALAAGEARQEPARAARRCRGGARSARPWCGC